MRRQTLAALVLAPVLVLGLQGCGGDGGKAGSSGTAKAAGDLEKMRKFAQCMRANGVDMEDPKGDGEPMAKTSAGSKKGDGGGAPRVMEEAQKKCRHLMPNGGRPTKPKPEQIAQQRAYSKCMRANGVPSFPDPQPDGSMRLKAGKGTGIDPNSQGFKDAEKACRKFTRGAGGDDPGTGSQGDGS
ncbi:hypothetical protein [Actinomadura graeca]|uniref:hypothetical protein n=1 Tax=Actinomadura graeca TaxID=2750812 RepID=UPI001E293FBB|nr:hypothetical protein [Actinomadura graeca]